MMGRFYHPSSKVTISSPTLVFSTNQIANDLSTVEKQQDHEPQQGQEVEVKVERKTNRDVSKECKTLGYPSVYYALFAHEPDYYQSSDLVTKKRTMDGATTTIGAASNIESVFAEIPVFDSDVFDSQQEQHHDYDVDDDDDGVKYETVPIYNGGEDTMSNEEYRRLLSLAQREVDRSFLNRTLYLKDPAAGFLTTYDMPDEAHYTLREKTRKTLDLLMLKTFGRYMEGHFFTTDVIIEPRRQAKKFLKKGKFPKSQVAYLSRLNQIMVKCTRSEAEANLNLYKVITSHR